MAPRRIDARELPAGSALARRLAQIEKVARAVTLEHDGTPVEARAGEPVALSLAAAGRLTLARSPKYHRPRGAACLRGDCDGCLVRAGDQPGVMACRLAADSGMKLTSQNAFPTAGFDVFAVTDWFFPKHLDHHRLMVDFGDAVNRTMQVFARRMAGSGTLPELPTGVVSHRTRDVDVLVVGAGRAGLAAVETLAREGLSALLVDEEPAPGGAQRDRVDLAPERPTVSVDAMFDATAAATYANETLVVQHGAITRVTCRARLFATGTRDVIPAFARNDLPGVVTARAFARALTWGVLLGERVVIVGPDATGARVNEVLHTLGVKTVYAPDGEVVEAHGATAVRKVTVREKGTTAEHRCEVLVCADEPVPAYELAGQAGAGLAWDHDRRCFAPRSDDEGATERDGVYVAGTVRRRMNDEQRSDDGVRVARRIARDLRGSR